MKTTASISLRSIAVIVMLSVFLGTASTAIAGERNRVDRPRHAPSAQMVGEDTGRSTPRPVADETPVNPRHLKSASTDGDAKVDSNKPPSKRSSVRRR